MTPSEAKKKFIDLIKSVNYFHVNKVFDDFLTVTAIALRNSVDLEGADKREQTYHGIIKAYERQDQDIFHRLYALLVVMMDDGLKDHLGMIYEELELSEKGWLGQFFTPREVSMLMAEITLDDSVREKIKTRGFIKCYEPTCGGGATIFAFADMMEKQGYNYQTQLLVVGQDLSLQAVKMCYIQLSLFGISATVIHGNTLLNQEFDKWQTPMLALNWWRFREREAPMQAPITEPIKRVETPIEPLVITPPITPRPPTQAVLF